MRDLVKKLATLAVALFVCVLLATPSCAMPGEEFDPIVIGSGRLKAGNLDVGGFIVLTDSLKLYVQLSVDSNLYYVSHYHVFAGTRLIPLSPLGVPLLDQFCLRGQPLLSLNIDLNLDIALAIAGLTCDVDFNFALQVVVVSKLTGQFITVWGCNENSIALSACVYLKLNLDCPAPVAVILPPISSCSQSQGSCGTISGGAHVTTFNGDKFNFRSWGEFKFCELGKTRIHTCHEPCPTCITSSPPIFHRGCAFIHLGVQVVIRLLSSGNWIFICDGAQITIDAGITLNIKSLISITRVTDKASDKLFIRTSEGLKIQVSLFSDFLHLDLDASASLFDKTSGLCGTWDCNSPSDDPHTWLINPVDTLFNVDLDLWVGCTWGADLPDIDLTNDLSLTVAQECCLSVQPLLIGFPDMLAICIMNVIAQGDEFTCSGDLTRCHLDVCNPGCKGNSHCDLSGSMPKCVCDPGFSGPDCTSCSCPNCTGPNQRCIDGVCVCTKGWCGDTCSTPIPIWRS